VIAVLWIVSLFSEDRVFNGVYDYIICVQVTFDGIYWVNKRLNVKPSPKKDRVFNGMYDYIICVQVTFDGVYWVNKRLNVKPSPKINLASCLQGILVMSHSIQSQ